MIDQSRLILDDGVAAEEILLLDDLLNPMHLRDTIRFDHEIDADLLAEAWERTKRVYPIIDAVLEVDEGEPSFFLNPVWRKLHAKDHLYFMWPKEGENRPIRSKVPIAPCTDAVGGRMLAVTYYGDTLTVGVYHLLVDGVGFIKIVSTFVYSYLALYTGHEDEQPVVELREGRAVEDYFIPVVPEKLFAQGYTPVDLVVPPARIRGFYDALMQNDDGVVLSGTIEIDASDFMHLCKSCGANPSAMIAVLLGRAIYGVNPDQQEGIVFGFTISARSVLGLEDSIANAAVGGVSFATRDDIEHKSLAEVTQRVRADLGKQRTRDHVISFIRFTRTEHGMFQFIPRPVTYMGAFSVGNNTKHIKEMFLGTKGDTNVFLYQVNDRFYLTLHYGKATQEYLDEFAQVFGELGVSAEITHPAHPVDLDVTAPVL